MKEHVLNRTLCRTRLARGSGHFARQTTERVNDCMEKKTTAGSSSIAGCKLL